MHLFANAVVEIFSIKMMMISSAGVILGIFNRLTLIIGSYL